MKHDLGTEPIGKLIRQMSVPAVIGVMAYNLYNAADTIFVARGVGTEAAGGLAVSFPLFIFLSALTSTLGGGGGSVISRALGERDYERAGRAVGNCFGLFFAAALLVTVFGLIFLEPLLYLMGVTDTLMPYAKDYTRIILMGAVTCTGFSNLIRAEGSSRYAMLIWVIPVSVNLALDPILIFGLDLGIAGAAVATVASQCVSMGMSIYYFFLSKKRERKICPRHFIPDPGLLREIILIGIPSFIQTMGYSVSVIIVNQLLGRIGGDLAISTYGIASRVQSFMILGATGVVQGVSPIIGYNYGERKAGRVEETMKRSCQVLGVYGAAICAILLAAGDVVIRIFSADPAVVQMGGHIIRILGLGTAFSGIQALQAAFFQAVGKKGMALFLSLCGNLICFLPVLGLLGTVFGLEGIWYSFPVSSLLAMAISGICVKKSVKYISNGT